MIRARAFTLIELLVVVAIILVMIGLIGPVADKIFRGQQLGQAVQLIQGHLALARQTAVTQNRPVEVRFYKCVNSGGSAGVNFHALQALAVIKANRLSPLGKISFLPRNILMDSGSSLSSLLDTSKRTVTSGTEMLRVLGANYSYMSFRFQPDGSTNLPPTNGLYYFTLHDQLYGDGLPSLPTNFATVEIDPTNGTVKIFRP